MGVQALRLTCAVLLLICWTSDPVNCQSVKIEGVSTNFFTISWPRVLQWFGVESFTITTQPEDSHSCQQTIPCKNDTCVYNSRGCSSIFPCTNTSIVVTGDNYSAPQLSLITAPPMVESITVEIYGANLTITWNNSAAEASNCLEETDFEVHLSEDIIFMHTNISQNTYWKSLCGVTDGFVVMQNNGGDGSSRTTGKLIHYHYPDVIPLVASLNTTSKCTEVSVTWVYNDVCPDVAYITVYIERGEYYSTKNTSITSYVFQGLLIGTHYEVCVKAMAADLSTLGSHVCEYISTASDVVADLTLEALGSTELSANWLPPICPAGIGLYYEVQVEDETFFDYHYDENMQETNHTWSDLRYGNTYSVCVTARYKETKGEELCKKGNTLLSRPYLVKVEEISYTKLLVTWDFDTYQGDNSYDFKFNVTWGDSLENSAITQYYQYSIRGYNVSRENRRVCVRATQHDDFFSQNGCLGDPYVPTTQAPYPVIDGMSAGLIAFIVIGCLAAVFAIISIGSIAAIRMKRRNISNSSLTHQNNLGIQH
ncbi:uncharacterized protein LOC121879001 [Homarus americanus]|uniref:uncharacterized protein LOC121879001 n=1 Tax=Homarus americanus TaxID=6706 RepID=UPI001C46E8B4|nr:uncharacterized protein LOC121879001 [Homarus americanus]